MEESFKVSIHKSFEDIKKEDWDKCANPPFRAYNPFVSFDFLDALERSSSATSKTGWLGQHMLLYGKNDEVVGALPCYLKNHSHGEYVFDYGWADAFERAGSNYYPKLQVSIPFTPVTGPRFLTKHKENEIQTCQILAEALNQHAKSLNISSIHATFITKSEWLELRELNYLQRADQQFHFENKNYKNFDDFLKALTSRKRKQIKRERREALANNIEVEWITGAEITEHHLDVFFNFYIDTGMKKWGTPYLTRSFFSLLYERMANNILFIFAKRDNLYIAGALNMIGGDTLYGRYWGCLEEHPFLHFEICYYQAIDYALQNNLKRVEAGAQGGHKLIRGYEPILTYSAHYITHDNFREAIARYLNHERQQVAHQHEILVERTPFKNSTDKEEKS